MLVKSEPQLIVENALPQARLGELADQSAGEKGSHLELLSKPDQDLVALLASEIRYRRLFETAKDGILMIDAVTGLITDANPFIEEMLGYSHDELVGRTLWEIGPVKDISASQDALRHLQEREYIRYENLPLETKSQQRVQVEFVSNVYLVDGNRVIQCNIRDITARRNAEEDAQAAHAELVEVAAELQVRDSRMKMLMHMVDLLQSCTSVAEAYQVVSLVAGDLFRDQSGGFAILNSEKALETVAVWGGESIIESTFSPKDCWAMRRGQPHGVLDPKRGLLCHHYVEAPKSSTLCLPLMVQGETLGLLTLFGGDSSTSEQQMAITMGEAIKLSLSNIRLRDELREQAIRDPLTGLYNRRYLEENLARELFRSQRQESELCLAMVDIDSFKQVNDSYGHGAGDTILREVGTMLSEHLRNSDISCRYGGDEFLLVMPDSSLEDTHQRLDQIRTSIKKQTFHYSGKLLGPITISIGVAAAKDHGFLARETIRAADEALSIAKQEGNDQIILSQRDERSFP